MRMKNFIIGFIPCIYACQNTNGSSKVRSCEEKEDWTSEEDEKLKQLVREHGDNWEAIAAEIGSHSSLDCFLRWCSLRAGISTATNSTTKSNDNDILKQILSGSWKPEEDDLLIQFVLENGPIRWNKIAKQLDRPAKQCRERWSNHLNPKRNPNNWSEEEDLSLIRMVENIGYKWDKISKVLPGRTMIECKNRWDSTFAKKKYFWTTDEENVLKKWAPCHYTYKDVTWGYIALQLPGRTGRACKEHWKQYLRSKNLYPIPYGGIYPTLIVPGIKDNANSTQSNKVLEKPKLQLSLPEVHTFEKNTGALINHELDNPSDFFGTDNKN